jgi:hypothetical protein
MVSATGANRVLSKDRQTFPAGGCVDTAFTSQTIDIEYVFRLGGAPKRFFSLSFP